MRLIEENPLDEEVKKYVEKYQLYVIEEPSYLKTIPNARLECWLIIDGGFDILDTQKNVFVPARKRSGYPATDTSLLFSISSHLFVLNIKFKLTTLAFKEFAHLYPPTIDFDLSKIFPQELINAFYTLKIDKQNLEIRQLDEWLKPLFSSLSLHEDEIAEFISQMNSSESSIEDLTELLHITPKTLTRRAKKYIGLTPKKLLLIKKFNKATRYANDNGIEKLIDLIDFGYYDQSHFIRECKRISGLNPTQLFNGLKLSTHDLLAGKNKETL